MTTMYIAEEDNIHALQEKFTQEYPGLKLEFFQHPHAVGESSPRKEKLPPDTPIEDIRMMHTFGPLDISANRTVAAIEYDFYHHFGLSVQVYRKYDHTWIETSRTDHWTLAEQNTQGLNSSDYIPREEKDVRLEDLE